MKDWAEEDIFTEIEPMAFTAKPDSEITFDIIEHITYTYNVLER